MELPFTPGFLQGPLSLPPGANHSHSRLTFRCGAGGSPWEEGWLLSRMMQVLTPASSPVHLLLQWQDLGPAPSTQSQHPWVQGRRAQVHLALSGGAQASRPRSPDGILYTLPLPRQQHQPL